MTDALWTPSAERIAQSNMQRFIKRLNAEQLSDCSDYASLHQWSVEQPETFWQQIWDFTGLIGERGEQVLENGDKMPGAKWFPGAKLNYAQNLLRRRDGQEAIVFWGEDQVQRRLSYAQLYDQVSSLAQALRAQGVVAGDRVAGFMPNLPETVIAMLAASSIGAIWSSCSPDFGASSAVDRLGQVEPKVLFSADGYFYNGKRHAALPTALEIADAVPSIERVVVVPYYNDQVEALEHPRAISLADYTQSYAPTDIEFAQLAFDHPLFIMFSSGTTGVPKCIVHSAGGTLLQHLKEHQLHVDLKPGEKLFYFTTCGWMMWNWLVTALASEVTIALYDGSPFYPGARHLFDYCEQEKITVFGTSAKYLDACNQAGLKPMQSHDLSALNSILSTGSPLTPESYDFVYRDIKQDVCLSSISGGTDIISCFVLGNPTLPVYRGEIQCRGLGMAVNIYSDEGQPLLEQKGELVCTAPFPSMPVGFWNDSDGSKYHKAYFDRFDNIWNHGDYAEITARNGVIIHGRSDSLLNPGGVRIGTAEIYRQVEKVEEVVESVVVGQDWQDDMRVVLFVVLQEGVSLDAALTKKIATTIRQGTTPRHVPAKAIAVSGIPKTRSGKIMELAVKQLIHGQTPKNIADVANPECLDDYRDIEALKS